MSEIADMYKNIKSVYSQYQQIKEVYSRKVVKESNKSTTNSTSKRTSSHCLSNRK